jgi:release factor glutamine methyltransferase
LTIATAAFDPSTSRAEALTRLIETFEACGIEDPKRDARITLSAASGLARLALIVTPQEPLGSAAARVEEFATRRAAGEPLSRILGKREFWGLELAISPQVLDPRPETETVIEASLRRLGDRREESLRVLDLGVGSGALLRALLAEFTCARGVGVDISAGAAEVARRNIEACGLAGRAEIRVGDWTKGLEGRFDLIVSNPPYVRTTDLSMLPREVLAFDPRLALDGGIDGLDAYRRILPEARGLLSEGGWLMVEIGAGQVADVAAIAGQCGLVDAAVDKDLAGLDRVVAARSPKAESASSEP